MALSFMKKGGAAAAPNTSESTDTKADAPQSQKTTSSTTSAASGSASGKPKISFLKTGKAAKETIKNEEVAAEARKAQNGKMFTFYMKPGEDRQITFLDGELDEDGMLAVPVYHEHVFQMNGSIKEFVCTADVDQSQPCPICEKGDSRPTMVGLLTVIDHSEHTIQSGPNAGQKRKNERRLFKAKMGTLKLLTKAAAKRGGLTGCTFDVSRVGEKSANVGSNFDFTKKWDDLSELAAHYGLDEEGVTPANYEEEVPYLTPDELIALGVGKKFTGIGTKSKEVDKKGLADQL